MQESLLKEGSAFHTLLYITDRGKTEGKAACELIQTIHLTAVVEILSKSNKSYQNLKKLKTIYDLSTFKIASTKT